MKKKKTIYVFGNPLLDCDSAPLKLLPRLRREFPSIKFQEADPNENLRPENKELYIIDTVEGIDEVRVINDIEKIKTEPMYSAHDFDLGFNLQLLHKLGKLKRVIIFGIPMVGNERRIYTDLTKNIKQFLKSSLI